MYNINDDKYQSYYTEGPELKPSAKDDYKLKSKSKPDEIQAYNRIRTNNYPAEATYRYNQMINNRPKTEIKDLYKTKEVKYIFFKFLLINCYFY